MIIYNYSVENADFDYDSELRVTREMYRGKSTSRLQVAVWDGKERTWNVQAIDFAEVRKLRDALSAHIKAEGGGN